MPVLFFSEDTISPELDQKLISEWIINTIQNENKQTGNVNVIYTSDNYLLQINKKYLNRNDYTDIITFDYCDNQVIAGDLFISVERVYENAVQYNTSYDNELSRVIIHGVLHLLGYDDASDDEKKLMKKKENEYLNRINL